MEQLATDTEPEAAAVRQLVVERYDVDRMVDSYLELYLQLPGSGAGKPSNRVTKFTSFKLTRETYACET